MSAGVLAPELARLEREAARDPGDPARVLALARLRLRCGDRVGAFAALDAFLDRGPHDEAAALHAQALAAGRYRPTLEPVALASSPDTGKPRTRHSISALAVDPAETHLAVAKGSGDVYLVPLGGGEPRFLGSCGKKKSARAAAFLPDGSAFLTADASGMVRRWDVATGEMTRVTKKLDNILRSVAAWRGGVATASLEHRFRLGPDGALRTDATDIGLVSRSTAAAADPVDPLAEALQATRAAPPDPSNLRYSYWDEYRFFDLHGTSAAILREGKIMRFGAGAWRTYADPRLVRRFSADLAPGGRAMAIGPIEERQRLGPMDPPLRGLHLALLGEELELRELLPETPVCCMAFSPSGGLLVVGAETGELFVVSLFEEEAPAPGAGEAGEAGEAPVAEGEPPWESAGTRMLHPEELTLLGTYGPAEGGGFPAVAGKVLGMSDDVVLLGKGEAGGKVIADPLCLALKSGRFEATEKFWSRRRFPHHRAEEGRDTPSWMKVTGETARAWVATSDRRFAAALVRGAPEVVWVGPTSGRRTPVRLEAGGPIVKVAWAPRGRRLAVLRRDGVVEIFGSVAPGGSEAS